MLNLYLGEEATISHNTAVSCWCWCLLSRPVGWYTFQLHIVIIVIIIVVVVVITIIGQHPLRLSYEAVRIAVAQRLGWRACNSHVCVCGKTVDTGGLHVLACHRSSPRQQRHRQMNDMVWRAIKRAQIPAVKEPPGLFRSDGKRPGPKGNWWFGTSLFLILSLSQTGSRQSIRDLKRQFRSRIMEQASHWTGARNWETHHCHHRGQQRIHLCVLETVRGSSEG